MSVEHLKPYPKGVSGNPGGKPRSRKALEKEFVEDLYESWQRDGKTAINRMIAKRPGDYVRMVAGLLPKDINLNDANSLDRERAARLLELVSRRLEELTVVSEQPAGTSEVREQAPRLPALRQTG